MLNTISKLVRICCTTQGSDGGEATAKEDILEAVRRSLLPRLGETNTKEADTKRGSNRNYALYTSSRLSQKVNLRRGRPAAHIAVEVGQPNVPNLPLNPFLTHMENPLFGRPPPCVPDPVRTAIALTTSVHSLVLKNQVQYYKYQLCPAASLVFMLFQSRPEVLESDGCINGHFG